MKKIVIILSTFVLAVFGSNSYAKDALTKTTIKVSGSCDLCKERIEKAAKIPGVKAVEWMEETHLLTVAYAPVKTSLDKIQQSIAAAGYDTEKYKASEEDYLKLPECCQYDREK